MKRDVRLTWRSTARSQWVRGLMVGSVLMLATAGLHAASLDANQVIVPNSAAPKTTLPSAGGTGTGAFTIATVLLLAGAGAWLLWRGRAGGMANFNRAPRQLAVDETRSLGNRQYLVVASYQNKKFLLGVCPGRIDLLSPLDDTAMPKKDRE